MLTHKSGQTKICPDNTTISRNIATVLVKSFVGEKFHRFMATAKVYHEIFDVSLHIYKGVWCTQNFTHNVISL